MDGARTVSAAEAELHAPAHEMGETMIKARDVDVVYRVYEEKSPTLRSLVKSRGKRRPRRRVHAVRGVDVDLRAGEVVGLIGPNGSGKSTLFQALAGLLPVTSGEIEVRSQPLLLGVEGALKVALSGRRNVYIGCLALGLTKSEIDERFDDIVAFAGLEEFIDIPMRAYSSGMKARLQFAIATAVTPDILLVDEALAVGDRRFRKRSRAKLEEVSAKAGAVMLVSHASADILEMCTRAMWLEKGKLVMEGAPEEVVRAYEQAQDEGEATT